MNSNILSFVPKTYFPRGIYLSGNFELILNTVAFKRPLIVISKTFKDKNKVIFSRLETIGKFYIHSGEPSVSDISKLEKNYKSGNYDLLISVGGGSVIDLAKILKKNLRIKLIAIPTTIGSSAEVSQFAVVTDNNKKIVYHSEELLPDYVIFDYQLFMTLDTKTLIYQGIDAFAHSLEALVSRLANPLSDSFALSSLESIYLDLLELKKNGKSREILERLKISAMMAGLAQSGVGTGLIHALAHYFGALCHIQHAKTVSIFFTDCLEVNLKNSDKYKKIDVLKTLTSKNILSKTLTLFDKLGMKKQKLDYSGDLEEAAGRIKSDVTILTNPFLPTTSEIVEIIKKHI